MKPEIQNLPEPPKALVMIGDSLATDPAMMTGAALANPAMITGDQAHPIAEIIG
jgi:predicted HAD superfamily phosphohydrolase YqeG